MPVAPRPPRRARVSPLDTLSYGIGAVSLVAGAVVLEGSLLPPVPARIRITMGLVVLLMGLYRIVVTRTRAQQRAMEAYFEEERERTARERPTEL